MKKITGKLAVIALTAGLMGSSCPFHYAAAAEKYSVETDAEGFDTESNEQIVQKTYDLNALDYRTAPIAEINTALAANEERKTAIWFFSLPEEEQQDLMNQEDFYLNGTILTQEGTLDSDTGQISLDASKTQEESLYDYMKQIYETRNLLQASFGSATGYMTIIFKNAAGTKSNSIRIAISGLSTSKETTTRQNIKIKYTKSGSFLSFSGLDASEKSLLASSSKKDTYTVFYDTFAYTKPAGYKVTGVEYANVAGGRYKLDWNPAIFGYSYGSFANNYTIVNDDIIKAYNTNATMNQISTAPLMVYETAQTHKLMLLTNVIYNMGVGASNGTATGHEVITVTLTPATYHVIYDTKGGSAVQNQTVSYDQAFTLQPAPSKKLTVTFDGNGGTAGQASAESSCSFGGWNSTLGIKAAGSSVTNLTTANGGKVAMTAIWKEGTITLPSASRTGYTLTGWGTSTNAAKGSAANTEYKVTENQTLHALWTPNTYTISFDSREGSECEDMTVFYDSEVELPVPEREGYLFEGWSGAGGANMKRAKNLAESGNVSLTAQWKAEVGTEYTVNHYLQTAADSEDYELEDSESFYGTTDTTITVSGKDYPGYITPASQQITINGDGSSTVDFYYRWEKKQESSVISKDNTTVIRESTTERSSAGNQGLSDADMKKLLSLIEKYEGKTVTVKGMEYLLEKTRDGSFEVKLVGSGTSTNVVIPDSIQVDGVTVPVTTIGSTFKNDRLIKSVTIGKNISSIAGNAFENCTSLKKVKLGNNLLTIGNNAFKNCTSLTKITIPKKTLTIGTRAFYNCRKLKKISVSANSKLLRIGKEAFCNCTALKKTTVPKKVASMGKKVFYNCFNLSRITLKTGKLSSKTIGTKAFGKTAGKLIFKVPSASKKTYRKFLLKKGNKKAGIR